LHRAALVSCRARARAQLGVATPEDAVAAARVVGGDVAGIDVNMGCPKSFSVNNGFGAALLAKPRDAAALVAALKAATALPVTAKIRLLESPEDTISFMRALEAAGVDAIAVPPPAPPRAPPHPPPARAAR